MLKIEISNDLTYEQLEELSKFIKSLSLLKLPCPVSSHKGTIKEITPEINVDQPVPLSPSALSVPPVPTRGRPPKKPKLNPNFESNDTEQEDPFIIFLNKITVWIKEEKLNNTLVDHVLKTVGCANLQELTSRPDLVPIVTLKLESLIT